LNIYKHILKDEDAKRIKTQRTAFYLHLANNVYSFENFFFENPKLRRQQQQMVIA
jgi:hypothetical protein